MAEIGGSVEDYLAKKLKLNELTKKEQVVKVLEYFKSIITGEIKSTPPEFSGLLQLMIDKLPYDDEALITKFVMRRENDIKDFFVRNFQRFNYFEFKHKFMIIRGEIPEKEFQVPRNSNLNYERIEPVNLTPYVEILEPNQLDIKIKKERTEKTDPQTWFLKKENANNDFDQKIKEFKKTLQVNINKGMVSREIIEKKLSEIEELCISAIQMRYNTKAINELREVILGEKDNGSTPSRIFDELKMSMVSRELFYRMLVKKLK